MKTLKQRLGRGFAIVAHVSISWATVSDGNDHRWQQEEEAPPPGCEGKLASPRLLF